MSARLFNGDVGVAPGTTTMMLAGTNVRVVSPYARGFVDMRGSRSLGAVDTGAHIRWDLIATVGGFALVVALTTGLIASAIGK